MYIWGAIYTPLPLRLNSFYPALRHHRSYGNFLLLEKVQSLFLSRKAPTMETILTFSSPFPQRLLFNNLQSKKEKNDLPFATLACIWHLVLSWWHFVSRSFVVKLLLYFLFVPPRVFSCFAWSLPGLEPATIVPSFTLCNSACFLHNFSLSLHLTLWSFVVLLQFCFFFVPCRMILCSFLRCLADVELKRIIVESANKSKERTFVLEKKSIAPNFHLSLCRMQNTERKDCTLRNFLLDLSGKLRHINTNAACAVAIKDPLFHHLVTS